MDLGEGIEYSSDTFDTTGTEAEWLTIATTVHEALSPSYDASVEIDIEVILALRGAIADGHDAVARGHVYLEHFPPWKDAVREGGVRGLGEAGHPAVDSRRGNTSKPTG